jgi:hypothetical protein
VGKVPVPFLSSPARHRWPAGECVLKTAQVVPYASLPSDLLQPPKQELFKLSCLYSLRASTRARSRQVSALESKDLRIMVADYFLGVGERRLSCDEHLESRTYVDSPARVARSNFLVGHGLGFRLCRGLQLPTG